MLFFTHQLATFQITINLLIFTNQLVIFTHQLQILTFQVVFQITHYLNTSTPFENPVNIMGFQERQQSPVSPENQAPITRQPTDRVVMRENHYDNYPEVIGEISGRKEVESWRSIRHLMKIVEEDEDPQSAFASTYAGWKTRNFSKLPKEQRWDLYKLLHEGGYQLEYSLNSMQMGFRLQEMVWTFSTKPREELFDYTVKTLKAKYDQPSPRSRPTQSRSSSRQPSPISLSQTPAAPHDEPNYREVSRPKTYTPPTEPLNQGMGMRPLPIRPANPGNSEANANVGNPGTRPTNPSKHGEKSDTATDALDRPTWKLGGRYNIATINSTDSVRFAKAADSLTKFYAANPSRMYSGGPDESFDG